jgi:hypothetical protein
MGTPPGKIASLAATLVLGMASVAVFLTHPRLLYLFDEKVGYWPHLAVPRSYREKMQWRKVFDRNPRFVRLQDKLQSKEIVHELVPDQRMPAVLWSGDDADAIPLDRLPPTFVLKTNHGSGFNKLADGHTIAPAQLIDQARTFLKSRWGRMRREWAYTQIVPKLFVEEVLRTRSGQMPDEYSVTVMNGRPLFVTAQRQVGGAPFYGYYTTDWVRLPVLIGAGRRDGDIERPRCLDHMLHTAAAVGRLVDMLRVDFYDVDGVDYFGECTVYSVSGLLPIRPRNYDFDWGRQWDIGESAFFTARLGPALRLYRWALATRLAASGRLPHRGSEPQDR